jgi:hypothetical protein
LSSIILYLIDIFSDYILNKKIIDLQLF